MDFVDGQKEKHTIEFHSIENGDEKNFLPDEDKV